MRKSLYDYCAEHNRIELLNQWDEAANLPVTPQTVTYGSKEKIAWRCFLTLPLNGTPRKTRT